jgi:hypothetical protein
MMMLGCATAEKSSFENKEYDSKLDERELEKESRKE